MRMSNIPQDISECPNSDPATTRQVDRLRRICPKPQQAQHSVNTSQCGCPWQSEEERCYKCEAPDTLQVRILYPNQKCVKKPCNFVIPAVPCREKPIPKIDHRPCKYDMKVEHPGPNDSYGLNGLNWYDWQMSYYNKHGEEEPMKDGLVTRPPPPDFPTLQCELPIECYARGPGPVRCSPSAGGRVLYSRDWRCCTALPPPAWRPPFA